MFKDENYMNKDNESKVAIGIAAATTRRGFLGQALKLTIALGAGVATILGNPRLASAYSGSSCTTIPSGPNDPQTGLCGSTPVGSTRCEGGDGNGCTIGGPFPYTMCVLPVSEDGEEIPSPNNCPTGSSDVGSFWRCCCNGFTRRCTDCMQNGNVVCILVQTGAAC
jgi:hypothetical protein